METSAIGTEYVTTTQEATSRGFNDLGSADFLALLIAELQSQDPMDPADNKEIVAQMASMRQMEQSQTLNDTLKLLASEQRFGSTAALIGHYVSGTVTNEAGDSYELQGLVIGVRFQGDGKAVLELHNGKSLPVDAVEQVTLLENLAPEILEQLQEELDLLGGDDEDGGEEGDKDGGETARLALDDRGLTGPGRGRPGSQGRPGLLGGGVRQFGREVDTVAELLDSLLSPGVSVGV